MNTTALVNEAPDTDTLLSKNEASSVTTELLFIAKATILAGSIIAFYVLAWI